MTRAIAMISSQSPRVAPSALAQMICDPSETCDLDWQAYPAAHRGACDADGVLTASKRLREI
jgi:hypothetical protein